MIGARHDRLRKWFHLFVFCSTPLAPDADRPKKMAGVPVLCGIQ
jgi:hypothetical protein